jgi:hypothetical protein
MPSSTSSSSRRRRVALAQLAGFFAALCAGVLAANAAWRLPALRGHVVLDTVARPPPSSDYFLSATDVHVIDAQVFLHGLEDVCTPIGAADVIFFGDSRLLLGLRGEDLRDFFAERGLRFYLLGFAMGTDVLAARLVERCDAHPSLAVVHETGFFTGEAQRYDREALDSSTFEAAKLRMEFELAFAVRRRLHRVLPHPIGRDLGRESRILYRSRSEGGWWMAAGRERDLPVRARSAKSSPLPEAHRRAAERFRAELERRGARLVLATVPSNLRDRGRAHALAEHLGVPIVDPEVAGLRTSDGIHLRRESARRYAEVFLSALEPYLPEPRPR